MRRTLYFCILVKLACTTLNKKWIIKVKHPSLDIYKKLLVLDKQFNTLGTHTYYCHNIFFHIYNSERFPMI